MHQLHTDQISNREALEAINQRYARQHHRPEALSTFVVTMVALVLLSAVVVAAGILLSQPVVR